jgi:hypothetical protein|tara:strand:+ start:921 stop:1379 length:459 start_codon:yes stop_codon:yes gene_type:complete
MQPIKVKLSLFFQVVKLETMSLSKYQKLQELGIDIWKKRSEEEVINFQEEIFLIDEDSILLLGEKDKKVSEEDKTIFLRTLTKSIKKNKILRINKLENPKAVNNILDLGTDSSEYLEQFENAKISSYDSMTEICSSKETKQLFLEKLKVLNL